MSLPFLKEMSTQSARMPDLGVLRIFAIIRIGLAYLTLHTITEAHVMINPLWYPPSIWTPIFTSFALDWPTAIGVFQWVMLTGIISTVCLGLGLLTRYTGPIAAIACIILLCVSYSFGRLNHNANSVPLLLFIFSLSDWGHVWSLDSLINRIRKHAPAVMPSPSPEWPLWIFLTALSLPYFTSGFFKVIKGNFIEPGFVSAVIKSKEILWEVYGEVPAHLKAANAFLLEHVWLTDLIGLATLFLELFFFMALLSRHARNFILAFAVVFHASITMTCKILFFEHMCLMALLLTASLLISHRHAVPWFRDEIFPARELTNTQATPQRSIWKRSALAMVVAVLLFLVLSLFPIPKIDETTWLSLATVREYLPLFPINSNFYITGNDTTIALVFWCFGMVVMGYYVLDWLTFTLKTLAGVSHKTPGEGRLLIYDGDCGFCQKSVNWCKAHGADATVEFKPSQALEEFCKKMGVPQEEFQKRAYFVRTQGEDIVSYEGGAASINAVLRDLPGWKNVLYRMAGCLYLIQGIRQLEELGYILIAKNRHRIMPGACSIGGPAAS